jgi:hypothetical protein
MFAPARSSSSRWTSRRSSRRVRAAIQALLLAALVPSGSPALDNDGQAWFLGTARGTIAGDWKLYLEVQPRVGGEGLRQLILRPALGYQVTRGWSLWQGYGWTPSFGPFVGENRSFQQSLVETPRGRLPFALANRTRLEQRWIEGVSGVSLRARHMLRAAFPVESMPALAAVMYVEPFLTLNQTGGGPPAGFDQNRTFVGLSRALGAGVRLEGGYLNQFVRTPSGRPDLLRHVALVWLDFAW